MQILRPFLLFISIILFGWLFVSNANQINVATTLNDAEIQSEIAKISSFTDVEKIKEYSIGKINYLESIRQKNSQSAILRTIIIFTLVLLQIVLYSTRANFSNSKATDF